MRLFLSEQSAFYGVSYQLFFAGTYLRLSSVREEGYKDMGMIFEVRQSTHLSFLVFPRSSQPSTLIYHLLCFLPFSIPISPWPKIPLILLQTMILPSRCTLFTVSSTTCLRTLPTTLSQLPCSQFEGRTFNHVPPLMHG